MPSHKDQVDWTRLDRRSQSGELIAVFTLHNEPDRLSPSITALARQEPYNLEVLGGPPSRGTGI